MTPALACPRCEHSVHSGDMFCGKCGYQFQLTQAPSLPDSDPDAALLESLRRATLGEYDIKGELGRGGMAVVYLAHEIALARRVAIKVMLPSLRSLPGMARRFREEAQTAARLDHRHIIPIFAVKETPSLVFFVMRYVPGRSLSSIVRQVDGVPVPVVRAIFAEVGGALAYAHRQGVIHRDVKPSNILVALDGSTVVTDFGIAKRDDAPGLTLTGQILGSPTYMSPEQCHGNPVTAASDQYSLGTTVFEILAGRPPFVGPTALDIMNRQCVDPVPNLLRLRPDCPPDLAKAVTRMLAKDPARRWPSMDAAMAAADAAPLAHNDPMRSALISWAEEQEKTRPDWPKTPGSPAVAVGRRRKPPRLSGRLAAAAGIVLAALVVGFVAWQAISPPSGGPGAVPKTGLLMVTDLPPSARILIDGVPEPGPQIQIAPGGHEIRVDAAGFAPWSASVVVVAGQTDTVAFVGKVIPPPPTAGTVSVTELPPGGSIWIDGLRQVGPKIELAAGEYTVQLRAPGYLDSEYPARVAAGKDQLIPFRGTKKTAVGTGTLSVLGLPADGTIWVDGARETMSQFELPAGDHTLRVTAPGYLDLRRKVTIVAGRKQSIDYTGSKKPPPSGVLRLAIDLYATVSIDGVVKSTERDRLMLPLSAGRHTLRIERDGFETQTQQITILPGDTLPLSLRLTRRPR